MHELVLPPSHTHTKLGWGWLTQPFVHKRSDHVNKHCELALENTEAVVVGDIHLQLFKWYLLQRLTKLHHPENCMSEYKDYWYSRIGGYVTVANHILWKFDHSEFKHYTVWHNNQWWSSLTLLYSCVIRRISRISAYFAYRHWSTSCIKYFTISAAHELRNSY